ncbi:biotin carboxylase N-terminal domain-containing protein, partial [Pseudomonas viridiflava]|uniref:biotin carboxylase N-terminal domain-containing protein n=1 Tax=Pseudomonas viridiflava TaxID=33069 RepID=UPI0013CEB80A
MPIRNPLIANRGEIAIRIARAAAEMDIRSVAIYAEDEAAALHTRKADVAVGLSGRGVSAYLDMQQIIAIAQGQCKNNRALPGHATL